MGDAWDFVKRYTATGRIGDDRRDRNDDGCLAFQLINGQGHFNFPGLMEFVREVNLSECGCSYAVVAIMGPQSSGMHYFLFNNLVENPICNTFQLSYYLASAGKSTLLNNLFRTNFKEMNNFEGRHVILKLRHKSQTTQGIWLARSLDMEPLTLVMDIEGTDGAERGEDDTVFEKQSALFALAVADVVLINMWCHDIGRENASNKPLLRAVFQQTPEDKLEEILRRDLEKIWASIPKPSGNTNIQLSTFFKVQVEFLPNYERNRANFTSKVKTMKQKFVRSTAPGGLVGDRKEPASGFPVLAENIWEEIIQNKDLDLPAHKVMVATVRCEEICNEKYDSFEVNENWSELRREAKLGFISGFGERVNSIIEAYVSEYDAETSYFDEAVANAKRKILIDKILMLVEPEYQAMLKHLRLRHLSIFMELLDRDLDEEKRFSRAADDLVDSCLLEFEMDCTDVRVERANWDALKEMGRLQHDMKSHIVAKRGERLTSKIRIFFERKLKRELSDSVRYFLCEETDPIWSKIRQRFTSVMKSTLDSLDDAMIEFGVEEESRKEKVESIKKYAKEIVETKAREESGRVKDHMLKTFVRLFKHDYDSWPNSDWNNIQEIEAAARNALHAVWYLNPLNVLAGLAAIRLADDEAHDNIHYILSSALIGSADLNTFNYQNRPLVSEEQSTLLEDLDKTSWAEVPSSRTLITPAQCKQLWQEFMIGAKDAVEQAMKTFEVSANFSREPTENSTALLSPVFSALDLD
ncbi:hypothetical protein L6164_000322 [Bauhinia variegata]|uniref:Uncharacterized protein n=1 Tax=Bauhinia variegata TaxID=167791 RepID=A0ACB9Q5N7_BAUVA|nr:hypothetical protein L6164_000322 [Bauhinia variegata]